MVPKKLCIWFCFILLSVLLMTINVRCEAGDIEQKEIVAQVTCCHFDYSLCILIDS